MFISRQFQVQASLQRGDQRPELGEDDLVAVAAHPPRLVRLTEPLQVHRHHAEPGPDMSAVFDDVSQW